MTDTMTMNRVQQDTAIIEIRGLRKVFRDATGQQVAALDGVDLTVEDGQFWVLLGASGCGKTTLLRCLAGLEKPDEGSIVIRDDGANGRLPGRPAIGMVFQSYALWPHMTVAQNIAYPLTTGPRRDRPSAAAIRKRVDELLELMGLAGLNDRKISQLSGGQQQRVALARAIAPGSRIVLFDEPLSNIDAKVREQLRRDLRRMQRELGFTAVYVTHDQVEAFELADRIAVMDHGKVIQVGAGQELYDSPNSSFVARFIGSTNAQSGTVEHCGDGAAVVATEAGAVRGRVGDGIVVGNKATVFSRPHQWWIRPEAADQEANAWRGTYLGTTHLGWYDEHLVDIAGTTVRVWTSVRAAEVPEVNEPVWVGVNPEHCRVLL